jgi:hypothetical protein
MAKLVYISNVSLDGYIEDEHGPLGDRTRAGRPAGTHGRLSPTSGRQRTRLVDECHLFIRTVLVGGGKAALPSDTRADLELLDDRRLNNGVVYLRYRIPT